MYNYLFWLILYHTNGEIFHNTLLMLKNLLLNKFMKDCISEFVIWNESPDKQNMIGELFVYVKKNNYENDENTTCWDG